jgi:hypothetical protein
VRITNIDTLSAYFDRLITENIKLYFFNKDGLSEKVEHQRVIILEIKQKINELFLEILNNNQYNYIEEYRTFDESSIIEELEDLIHNDINIGEADRARLEETMKDNPSLDRMTTNEKRLRKANEGRAQNKNNIDKMIKEIVNGKIDKPSNGK